MEFVLTIGETARRSGVAASALRFYEEKGLIASERAGSGHRHPRLRKMTDTMLNGLMMDDFQLSLTALVERAERLSPDQAVVSRRPDGSVLRTTIGDCTRRARRLASG